MEGQERMEKEKGEKNGNKMEEGEKKEEKERSHQWLFQYCYLGRILNSLRDKPETCQSGVVP